MCNTIQISIFIKRCIHVFCEFYELRLVFCKIYDFRLNAPPFLNWSRELILAELKLQLSSLESRREVADLLLFHKILHNKVSASHLLSNLCLNVPTRRTRHTSVFATISRLRLQVRKNSYIPRCVTQANNVQKVASFDFFDSNFSRFKRLISTRFFDFWSYLNLFSTYLYLHVFLCFLSLFFLLFHCILAPLSCIILFAPDSDWLLLLSWTK